MAGLLGEIRRINSLGGTNVAEPFAGGAGAALSLLYVEESPRILINDGDAAIHDFWWTLTHRPNPFFQMLKSTRVNMTEWRRQRDIYRAKGQVSKLKRGFAAFYLNRCNRSGIVMNGGPIGGIKQTGEWKLGARYNKPELLKRCEKVADYGDRIRVSPSDGLDFIRSQDADSTFFFIDPPYYHKGRMLYLNALDAEYHDQLASELKLRTSDPWVLTYDDCPEIRRLYRGWATIKPFSLSYTARERRQGREVMIVPKWIKLPKSQTSGALGW